MDTSKLFSPATKIEEYESFLLMLECFRVEASLKTEEGVVLVQRSLRCPAKSKQRAKQITGAL